MTTAHHPEAAFSRTFRVGRRYRATVVIPRGDAGRVAHAVVEWSPGVPARLTEAERRAYAEGMEAAVAAFLEESRS